MKSKYILRQDKFWKPTPAQKVFATKLAMQIRDAGVPESASTLAKYYNIDSLKAALAALREGREVVLQ